MLQATIRPDALVFAAFHALHGSAWDFGPLDADSALRPAETTHSTVVAAKKAPFDISGTWENPSGEDVTFSYDARTGGLQFRWSFNSRATGSVTLRGSGVAVGDGAGGVTLSAGIPPFPLVIDGKLCEGSRFDFSAHGAAWKRGVLMNRCALVFTWQCPGEEPGSATNYCAGLWL